MDYVVVEGFEHSSLPKFVMADIEVPNCLRKVMLSELNDALMEELVSQVLGLDDYQVAPLKTSNFLHFIFSLPPPQCRHNHN